jgi:hypothetical protein
LYVWAHNGRSPKLAHTAVARKSTGRAAHLCEFQPRPVGTSMRTGSYSIVVEGASKVGIHVVLQSTKGVDALRVLVGLVSWIEVVRRVPAILTPLLV